MKRRTRNILLLSPLVLAAVAWLGFTWLMNSTTGANLVLAQALQALDGRLATGDVSGDLRSGLVLKDLRFTDDGLEISAPRVEISLDVGLAPLSVTIRSLDAEGPVLRLPGNDGADSEGPDLSAIMDALQLPVPVRIEGSEIRGLAVLDATGEVVLELDRVWLSGNLENGLQDLDIEVQDGDWIAIAKGDIQADGATRLQLSLESPDMEVSGELTGRLDDYRIEAEGQVQAPELGPVQFTLQGNGDLAGISLERLDARSAAADAEAAGIISWDQALTVELDIALQRLTPVIWLDDWPRDHPLEGELQVAWAGEVISISSLDLRAAGTSFEVTGSGRFDPDAGVLEAALNWSDLNWPLGSDEPVATSARGQMNLSGAPSDWRLAGGMEVSTPAYSGGEFTLSGHGGLDSAVFDIEKGEAIGGVLGGQARLDWSGALNWQADLVVEQADLGAIMPDWPARLSANLGIDHDTGTGRLALEFENLRGSFEGRTIEGNGGLVLAENNIEFDNIYLLSEASRVSLHGNLHTDEGIEFELDARRPGWLARQLGGNLSGSGRYAPGSANPLPGLQITGSDLGWDDLRIGTVTVTENPGHGTEHADLQLLAGGVAYGQVSIDEIHLNIKGDLQQQEVIAAMLNGEQQLRMALAGSMQDWLDPLGGGWQGQLTRLRAVLADDEIARLRKSADLKLARDEVDLATACLEAEESGALCIATSWQADHGMETTATLESLPLNLSRLFLEHDLEFSQVLNGEINWRQVPGRNPSGRSAITLSAGQFGDVEDGGELVRTAEGFIGFEMQEGNLTAGKLDIPLPGIGEVDVDFEVTGVALDGSGQIAGTANINFSDLSFIEALMTGLDEIHGSLASRLELGGVTSDPGLSGSISVSGAGFAMPYLGLKASNIELQGKIDHSDAADVRGTLAMGEGEGSIHISGDFSDWRNPNLEAELTGKRLRVAGLPDLEVDVDTEVSLGWQGQAWSIDGYIDVPHAYIQPITSLQTRVGESPDVRLVAGEMPPAPERVDTGELALEGGLKLRIGEDVRLEADIADLSFGGALDLSWDNTLVPMASGAIQILGEVTAWGPRLHMERSFIRFPNVPATQPVLDIRAERDVFGNTLVRAAGVRMGGSHRRPEIEAYTIPMTTRDRAWAVLITGSDVNFGQGVGALDVGTYIAPRIFMSYGVSLFDSDNVFGIRYDLKKGWGVKATSSQRESGIDISYTIEH